MRRAFLIALASIASFLLPGGAMATTTPNGSSSNAIFNSNTSSSSYGNANEAFFFRVKNSNSPNPGFTNGTIDINSDAVLMQAFINNGSSSSAASNTNLNITLPTGFATALTATAVISADNASAVTDSISMRDSQPFSLSFDQAAQVYIGKRSGTAANNYVNTATSDYRINGNVMTVHLGNWAGGYNQQGVVTVRVNVLRNTVAFVCTGLDRSTIDNNRSTFTTHVNGTAAGATISSYNFVVKDSGGNVIDNHTVSTSAQSAVYNFNQSKSGVYSVTATSTSDKGTTAAVSACSQSVTVGAVLSTTTKTTTPASTAIPNTGAGDVLGVFAGVSSLGAAGHYAVRRFRR
jgi:hypothetical protein